MLFERIFSVPMMFYESTLATSACAGNAISWTRLPTSLLVLEGPDYWPPFP
jgi:hypothetical protein